LKIYSYSFNNSLLLFIINIMLKKTCKCKPFASKIKKYINFINFLSVDLYYVVIQHNTMA